jgi:hypothetical protein
MSNKQYIKIKRKSAGSIDINLETDLFNYFFFLQPIMQIRRRGRTKQITKFLSVNFDSVNFDPV